MRVVADHSIEPGNARVSATWRDGPLASSSETLVVEGNHYFSRADVDFRYLEESDHTSYCPWKGTARYWDVVVAGARNPNAAWSYDEPMDGATAVTQRIAFWKGVEVRADS